MKKTVCLPLLIVVRGALVVLLTMIAFPTYFLAMVLGYLNRIIDRMKNDVYWTVPQ